MSVRDFRLEPFAPGYFSVLASWFENQTQLTQWGGPAVRYPLDEPQLESMLPVTARQLSWMALRASEAVGHVQVIGIDRSSGVARLGRIVIAPAFRGQRLALPMLQLALDQAFAMPGIKRVDLGVYTWNTGAIKTYARLGFSSGEVRTASVRVGDENWDLQEMSLAREAHQPGRLGAGGAYHRS
jgi:RimJ/RimL family protein N-acetyltransferase